MPPEAIWDEDPRGLVTAVNYLAIIPSGSMTYAEQLNAVLRLTLYYAAAVALIRLRPESFVLPLGAALVTYLLYEGSGGSRAAAARPAPPARPPAPGEPAKACAHGWQAPLGGAAAEGGACLRPTKHNPFMNQLPLDPTPFDPAACDPLDPGVRKGMRDGFQRCLFRDTSDLFERGNSERQFFTMPSNQPEDQTAFAEWVYGDARRGGRATKPPLEATERPCTW
jgi:hypothetical protein